MAKKTSSSVKKNSSQKSKDVKMAQKTDTAVVTPSSSNSSQDADEVLITHTGLKSLKEELEQLKSVRRKEIARRLKEAISYGDLSENSEYEEAKNEQAFVEGRIMELEKQIKHAKIIGKKKADAVKIGSTVKLKEVKTDALSEYTIVGSTEADPMSGRISNESPVGKAILGKKKGDMVVIEAPGGKYEYRVMSLK